MKCNYCQGEDYHKLSCEKCIIPDCTNHRALGHDKCSQCLEISNRLRSKTEELPLAGVRLPYSEPWEQCGLLHVSAMERRPVGRVCVVGKGESAGDWRAVGADVYITINEACYLVDRACYAVRGDGNTDNHRFMEWLPSYVTPMMPERLRGYYNYGWWFRWSDIGLDSICLTTLMAIRLAHYVFGASSIICVGLDNLYKDGTSYHPDCMNARNATYGVQRLNQRPRVRLLESSILAKCSHYGHDGAFVKGGIG